MTPEVHLLDVEVLIALAWPQHVHHARAHCWFDSLDGEWATTSITESAFLRLSTNRKVVSEAVPMAQALRMLKAIRAVPGQRFVSDSTSFAEPVVSLEHLVTSAQVTDLHLVQISAECGGVLVTLDRGIAQMLADDDRRSVLLIPQLSEI